MIKQIQIAEKLKKCRETAIKFYGDKYQDTIKPFKEMIKVVMKANNIDELPALLKISETSMYQDNPMGQMLFMAAAVELIENSK